MKHIYQFITNYAIIYIAIAALFIWWMCSLAKKHLRNRKKDGYIVIDEHDIFN